MNGHPNKRRALVTGGAGFLGSHLCEKLIAQGYSVTCLDNFYTGDMSNVAHLAKNPDFKLLSHDIVEPLDLEVDEIYNLACPASPVQYQRDPVYTTMVSVLGARNVLELAKRTGARVFQASTSEVYGDPSVHPQPESYWGNVNPIGPRSCYDEGKRCAETLFFDYYRQYGVDIRVVRIFNTYGPRMQADDGRVVSNFITQALRHQDITIYGDGAQTRSFCYVDDLIDAMLAVMRTENRDPEPYNIGNASEFTMLELAQKVIAMTGSRSRTILLPLPVDDPKQRRPDLTRVTSATGWSPKVSVDEGLARTIRYFSDALQVTETL